ncbi:DUF2062 domain-containing protein [Tropicimonas sp. IMCC34011]|uniref:DUF2062 domain-containing protein n=1 Tax=Tropicimonas sp. IMCC34011 TaxID=2248759 RepID=UPI001E4775A0|nr:DUF2062 domain-containing protein [Tropicimonas sp. IMCC34011]
MFKRREKRSWARIAWSAIWPRGGYGRAFQYVQHRVSRIPDRPERIARGIFAGVFVCFTPLFGLHFVLALLIGRILRANIFAALIATFFGNPITFPVIAWVSLTLGHFILGTQFKDEVRNSLFEKFAWAMSDLWANLGALFTPDKANWLGLHRFYSEVFLPYLVGGLLPGLIAGIIAFYLSLPVVTAYQKRRKGLVKRRAARLRGAHQPDNG